MRAALTLLTLLCSLTGARAAEVTVGDLNNASGSGVLPMNSNYYYSYSQQIFTAEEIGMTGTINSVTLWLKGGENNPEMTIFIYLKEVDKEQFDNKTDWVPLSATNIVYLDEVTVLNTEAQEYTFELTTPFEFSGQHNLLIAFKKKGYDLASDLRGMSFPSDDGVKRSMSARRDDSAYDPANPTFEASNFTSDRNVVKFDITPGIIVGDLNNASYSDEIPMSLYDNYSYSQQIYTAEELGTTAGTINSITLWMSGKANLPDMSYDLYMVETDKALFAGYDGWLPLNRTDIVCSGTLTVHNMDFQEYTFTLKEPFIYSGKGNLLIAFNKWADGSSSGLSTISFTATDNVTRTIYEDDDFYKFDPATPYFSFNTSASRNVMRFDITEKPVAAPPATLEVTDITYNSATLAWTGGTQFNNVEYKKEGEERFQYSVLNLTAETSWTLNSLEENTVYYARVQSIDDYQNVSPWKTVQFTTPHEVADLECIAETATTATLSWTENGTATQWYVSYVNDLGTSYGCEADSNPFTLNGLTEGRKYTAKVRASDSDAWSEPVTFEPTSKTVIGRGTATSSDLPTNTYYKYSLTEQLYTKEELGEAGNILSIDFYSTATECTRNLDIYMVSTDKTDLNNYISVNTVDLVFSGEVTFLQDAWTTITLDTPFEYDGQSNLVIVVDDNTGSYQSRPSFRVFSTQDYQALYARSDNTNYEPTGSSSYSPYDSHSKEKNQIRVAKGALPAVLKPTRLSVIDIAPTTASLGWTSAAQSFNVRWGTDANLTEWVSTASTSDKQFTLTGLEPETTYYVQVQACDPQKGNSAWATTTLTTIPMLTPPPFAANHCDDQELRHDELDRISGLL